MSQVITAWTILAAVVLAYGRSQKPEDLMDSVKGVAISSRRGCDGATNPQEDVELLTTFSSGSSERSFRLDEFESKYCRLVNLYFICAVHGHDRWKPVWSSDNQAPEAGPRVWLNTCAKWGSPEAPKYILSGWYKEGTGNQKLPWKQAEIKKVSASPEIYELVDPSGGTARVEIRRK